MAKTALTVNVKITGLRETLRAFRELPKEANDALRDRSTELARTMATRVAAAGQSDSPQSAAVASTVKARRDRVPVIEAGGTQAVTSSRVPAWKILFGSEFGARIWRQFRPHVGKGSYWIWRTVERNQAEISEAWNKAADDIAVAFSRGPGGS
jgi:hypothetical protein